MTDIPVGSIAEEIRALTEALTEAIGGSGGGGGGEGSSTELGLGYILFAPGDNVLYVSDKAMTMGEEGLPVDAKFRASFSANAFVPAGLRVVLVYDIANDETPDITVNGVTEYEKNLEAHKLLFTMPENMVTIEEVE